MGVEKWSLNDTSIDQFSPISLFPFPFLSFLFFLGHNSDRFPPIPFPLITSEEIDHEQIRRDMKRYVTYPLNGKRQYSARIRDLKIPFLFLNDNDNEKKKRE